MAWQRTHTKGLRVSSGLTAPQAGEGQGVERQGRKESWPEAGVSHHEVPEGVRVNSNQTQWSARTTKAPTRVSPR